MIELIFFIVVAALCWCLALSKAVRAKMGKPWWIKSVVDTPEDQQIMSDILLRVVGIVCGLILSVLAISVLVRRLR
jgi:uncharacterized membrane protein YhaH (DUF805 family)